MILDQVIGGCIAVIVAGAPAMVALLKIKNLHVLVNARLTELIAATAKSSHHEGQLAGQLDGRRDALATSEGHAVVAKFIVAEAAVEARALILESAKEARILLAIATEEARVLLAEATSKARVKLYEPET